MPPQHLGSASKPSGLQSTSHDEPNSSPAFWSHSDWQSAPTGRKRSLHEAALTLDGDENNMSTAAPIQGQDIEYVEGMTLIKSNDLLIHAGGQTGTWAEQNGPGPIPRASVIEDHPAMRSYKSQRLDLTASNPNGILCNGAFLASTPPKSAAVEPTVDDFTIYLGIGWSRLSNDQDIQAAARGWSKYIENHFVVTNPRIRLQSKGLASYLVEAGEGWFLFSDELKHGRLVSTSLEKTFDNLRQTPPTFEGSQTLVAAARTPQINIVSNEEIVDNVLYKAQQVLTRVVSEPPSSDTMVQNN
ncbi:MAG: hypothetical protein M1818_000846 [Claussenomyces sp. TS43310]|nr:MAG: hypothetical protein M1818_000846 [Claussenomyces sp. TS43310]